jgi:hypothetical protein
MSLRVFMVGRRGEMGERRKERGKVEKGQGTSGRGER